MTARPLNFGSGMPNVSAALNGWQRAITLQKRTQIVDGYGGITFTLVNFTFMGTVQPLQAKQIELKPEGQRSWTWLQIHIQQPGFSLTTNDEILINGTIFKVMGQKDYTENGYIEYHCAYEYQP